MKKFEFGSLCSCGKVHKSSVDKVICERGAIEKLPALLAEYGICTRGGLHCAPLVHQRLGMIKNGSVRVSCSYFNEEWEIYTLLRALREIISLYT